MNLNEQRKLQSRQLDDLLSEFALNQNTISNVFNFMKSYSDYELNESQLLEVSVLVAQWSLNNGSRNLFVALNTNLSAETVGMRMRENCCKFIGRQTDEVLWWGVGECKQFLVEHQLESLVIDFIRTIHDICLCSPNPSLDDNANFNQIFAGLQKSFPQVATSELLEELLSGVAL